MPLPRTKQINLNTVLLILLSALVGFGITKLDTLNTISIRNEEHLSQLDKSVATMVTKAEFNSALDKRDAQIEELKKGVEAIRRSGPARPRPTTP